jgi:hypothetical protein
MGDLFVADYSGKETVISIIIALVIIGIAYLVIPSNEDILCRQLRKIKSNEIKAKVSKVYVDEKEHLSKIVEYSSLEDGEEKILVLSSDFSPLFEVLKSGDRILKRKGSLLVTINSDTTIRIDFGVKCDE